MNPNKFKFDYNDIKKSGNHKCDDSILFKDEVKNPPKRKPINYKSFNEINQKNNKESCYPNTKVKSKNVKGYKLITTESNKVEECDESKPKKFYDNSARDNCTLISAGSARIEDESFLLLPRINSKQKTKVELKDTMHPSDYRVDLASDNIIKTKQYTSYYGDHYGPGKGFGNTVVSNEIRNGVPTRSENDVFNQRIESEINDRRDILFKDYQNPHNIIMPFPRGGEITRKSVQNNNKNLSDNIFSEFKFKY